MSRLPWFGRRRRERELREEIEAHLEFAVRERIERGEDEQAARRAAALEFGNRALIEETTRDMWGWSWLERLRRDVAYAARTLRRSPGFTTVAVLSLALGMGANTAIFSLLQTVLLRMLPVEQPEQLVELLHRYPGEPLLNGWHWATYEHFSARTRVYSAITGATRNSQASVRAPGGESETLNAEWVVANYFPVLGLRPELGRLIGPEDGPPHAASQVAVVSWRYWKSRFQLDPSIVGRQIVVQNAPLTVIGVAPRGFSGLQVGYHTDIWCVAERNENAGLGLLGRLRAGATLDEARAELRGLFPFAMAEMTRRNPDPLLRQSQPDVAPAGSGMTTRLKDRYAQPLRLLMGVVGVLLLVACVNLASLLLARAASRQREMAVRVSLGAGRWRLVEQSLAESLLLAAAGAVLGVLLAHAGAGVLVRILGSGRAHERFDVPVQIDLPVLLFTAAVAILTGLLFGLAPAMRAFQAAPAPALRQAGHAGEPGAWARFGRALVVAQVASSVLLLSAAALFVGALAHLRNDDAGFQRDHVLLVVLNPARSGYERAQLAGPYHELLTRLEAIPGVRSASICGASPAQGAGAGRVILVEGHPELPEERRRVALNWVAPKYFSTLGTPLLTGRDFRFDDAGRSRVAIVNLALARHYFGEASPLGRRIRYIDEERPFEIVGVVADAKYTELREAAPLTMYLNMFQEGRLFSQFALRTSAEPMSLAATVRHTALDSLKHVSVEKMITLSEQVDASLVPERLMATLSVIFGALGALIAAIGLYGLLAYTVARRTNEIGIRIALGAARGAVARMVIRDALGLTLMGLLAGAPLAYWARSYAAALIPDPYQQRVAPIAIGAVVIVALTLLAAYLPARRAARVDPMEALRCE